MICSLRNLDYETFWFGGGKSDLDKFMPQIWNYPCRAFWESYWWRSRAIESKINNHLLRLSRMDLLSWEEIEKMNVKVGTFS